MEDWRYTFTITDLGIKWRGVLSVLLYLRGKKHRYSLRRRLDGPQNQPGRCGVEKNILPMLGIEPPWASP
jgi:hypothetical protein